MGNYRVIRRAAQGYAFAEETIPNLWEAVSPLMQIPKDAKMHFSAKQRWRGVQNVLWRRANLKTERERERERRKKEKVFYKRSTLAAVRIGCLHFLIRAKD